MMLSYTTFCYVQYYFWIGYYRDVDSTVYVDYKRMLFS